MIVHLHMTLLTFVFLTQQETMDDLDTNHDGKIDLEEYTSESILHI